LEGSSLVTRTVDNKIKITGHFITEDIVKIKPQYYLSGVWWKKT
jgi:hypothetical protein